MSDEPTCACGHTQSQHWGDDGRCCMDCQCREFKLTLPWPDSEGWWWTSERTIVEVIKGYRSKMNAWVYEGDVYYETVDEWNQDHEHPTLFTKLLEQCPL